MLDKILQLYKDGKLNKGLFKKTAKMILQKEMDKLAISYETPLTSIQGELLAKLTETLTPRKAMSMIGDIGKLPEDVARKMLESISTSGVGSLSNRILNFIGKHKVLTGLGAVAGMSLFSKLMDALESRTEESHMDTVLQDVLAKNPEFDKEKTEKIFSVLRQFSPTIASNPEAAAGYIQPLMEWPIVPYTSIKDLSQIEKNLADAGKGEGAFNRTFSDLSKSLAGLLAFGD